MMQKEGHNAEPGSLKDRILAMPDDSVLFRSDFPEYHSEFVGSILAELTENGGFATTVTLNAKCLNNGYT